MPISLKIYRYLGHGLKMCILFGYNPQIILCHFFHKRPDGIDIRYLVCSTASTVFADFLKKNFTGI